uniref:Uncharacterized protein n=1 Tax=Romanomermis culicivorax TaxID=13658 RepID=A0A915JCS5_ROMCU
VKLERVLGLSVSGSSALAADPENGLIAYPAGPQKNRQGHIINVSKKTITCLSFCPAGRYLATGESGHQPRVRVWDTLNDNTQISDLNDHKFGIVAVAFSPNGSYLVSIGNQHDMTALSLSFGESGNYFVTAGVRHVKFWYMERSKGTKVRFATSLTLGSDFLFIGCSDGIIRIFTASKLSFVATLPLPHSLGIDVASTTLNPPIGDRYPDVVALCFEPKFFR